MIGLKVREKNARKVRGILLRFQFPFKETEGSTVFMLSDRYDAVNLLSYLFYVGVKAKLLLYI